MKTTITIPEKIILSRSLTNQLLNHAQSNPDREICGLLSGINGMPLNCHPINNTAEMPGQRFDMDAKEQIAALRGIRERGSELLGIYHSHPSSPAQPSRTDLALNNYPNLLYLIISLNTKGVLEMRGFRIDRAQQAQEVMLEITAN